MKKKKVLRIRFCEGHLVGWKNTFICIEIGEGKGAINIQQYKKLLGLRDGCFKKKLQVKNLQGQKSFQQ